MADDTREREADWREKLTPEQYAVTREGATERRSPAQYWDHHEDGVYTCVCCGEPLFDSDDQVRVGHRLAELLRARRRPRASRAATDASHGMVRTEVVCRNCGAHLGPRLPRRPGADGPCATASTPPRSTSTSATRTDRGPSAGCSALLVAGAAGGAPCSRRPRAATLTPAQLAGQRMVFGFPGTSPAAGARAAHPPRRGGRGGAAGGQRADAGRRADADRAAPGDARARRRLDVPLLVMIDQEGGLVRRLDGPPGRQASEIGSARAARGARPPGGPRAASSRAWGSTSTWRRSPTWPGPARCSRTPAAPSAARRRRWPARRSPSRPGCRGRRRPGPPSTSPGSAPPPSSTDAAPVRITSRHPAAARSTCAPSGRSSPTAPVVMLGTAIYPALDPARPRRCRAPSRPASCATRSASRGHGDRRAGHARARAVGGPAPWPCGPPVPGATCCCTPGTRTAIRRRRPAVAIAPAPCRARGAEAAVAGSSPCARAWDDRAWRHGPASRPDVRRGPRGDPRPGPRPAGRAGALEALAGRVLAERRARARATIPAFTNSAMDGYAMRADDAADGGALRLVGESRAGAPYAGTLGAGEARPHLHRRRGCPRAPTRSCASRTPRRRGRRPWPRPSRPSPGCSCAAAARTCAWGSRSCRRARSSAPTRWPSWPRPATPASSAPAARASRWWAAATRWSPPARSWARARSTTPTGPAWRPRPRPPGAEVVAASSFPTTSRHRCRHRRHLDGRDAAPPTCW